MTEQELKDYVADEVLVGIRSELNWEYTAEPEEVVKEYRWLGNETNPGTPIYDGKYPVGVDIPDGTVLTQDGGAGTYTLAAPVFADQKQIEITAVTGSGGISFIYTQTVIPDYYAQSVRSYDAIITETLFKLGVSDITTIPDYKARDYVRRETWRHIVWTTASDYDYGSDTAGFSRTANHNRAIEQLQIEDMHIQRTYAEVSPVQSMVSSNMQIRGVWK